jgi:hypothetical protein
MTLNQRDKRALVLFGMAVAMVTIYVATTPKAPNAVVAPVAEAIPASELRLEHMRQSVARVPGKQDVLKRVSADLAQREKGLIEAETGPQATEQLLGIVRKVARAQAPPVDIRSVELGQVSPYGDAYGQVTVAVTVECRVDQLVNMMADLSARPELIATSDLRMGIANPKEKTMSVRLAVAGLTPRRLVPQKKDTF